MKILSIEILTELALVLGMFGGVATTQYYFLEQSLSQDIESSEVRLTAIVDLAETKRENDKKLVEHSLESIDHRLDGIDQRLDGIDSRLDRMDKRFDKMDQRFDRTDQRFDKMDQRFDRTDQKLDNLIAILIEKEYQATPQNTHQTPNKNPSIRTD